MNKCWTLFANTGDAAYPPYTSYFCADTAELRAASDVPGRVRLFINGNNAWGTGYGNTIASGILYPYLRSPEAPYTRGPFGNCNECPNIPPEDPYDCINGACIKKSVYNTPGIYATLSACEVSCGIGCSGKCISNSDWAQIEGLSNKLKSTNCG